MKGKKKRKPSIDSALEKIAAGFAEWIRVRKLTQKADKLFDKHFTKKMKPLKEWAASNKK